MVSPEFQVWSLQVWSLEFKLRKVSPEFTIHRIHHVPRIHKPIIHPDSIVQRPLSPHTWHQVQDQAPLAK